MLRGKKATLLLNEANDSANLYNERDLLVELFYLFLEEDEWCDYDDAPSGGLTLAEQIDRFNQSLIDNLDDDGSDYGCDDRYCGSADEDYDPWRDYYDDNSAFSPILGIPISW